MFDKGELTRRGFLKGAGSAGALLCLQPFNNARILPSGRANSTIFRVNQCPVHDLETRHRGVDSLFRLLAEGGQALFQTNQPHPWGSPDGMIAPDDVVLIKVNCQWKCRGTTNTDLVRGLIHRILQHPDGFRGEVVIFENGQGQGAFDGDPDAWGSYAQWPQIDNGIWVNAEEENILTVDYLVNTVFAGAPVSSYLLDPITWTFITDTDHTTDGYRHVDNVSYPCFTTANGNRVELKEGIWTGSGHSGNLKLINIPVFKHHDGTGITGALKHTYGILSMGDGYSFIRHYTKSGQQCGKMFTLVRAPVLNIIDAIWVSQDSLCGYPPSTTTRTDILLGGIDPVALDYHTSKHILLPIGGTYANQHDPDSFSGLVNHLTNAQTTINNNGGIGGQMTNQGDSNIDLVTADADSEPSPDVKANKTDLAVSVASGASVSIEVGLEPGGMSGVAADHWIIAKTSFGYWSYVRGSGWQPGIHRAAAAPISTMGPSEVLNMSLPDGDYTFLFAVDDNTSGTLDATWWDSVHVHVGP